MTWQSIESAPRDGTRILVFFDTPSLGVQQVFWDLPEAFGRDATPAALGIGLAPAEAA